MFEVVATKEFEVQIEKLFGNYPRIEELRRAIVWSLNRNPRGMGYSFDENDFIWVTSSLPTGGIPKVRIVYRLSNEIKQVKLISISAVVDHRRN